MCLANLFAPPRQAAPVLPRTTATVAPPPPPAPLRADEENRSAVASQLEEMRRRKGRQATTLTGGLGDTSYGANVVKPTVTALGQS